MVCPEFAWFCMVTLIWVWFNLAWFGLDLPRFVWLRLFGFSLVRLALAYLC